MDNIDTRTPAEMMIFQIIAARAQCDAIVEMYFPKQGNAPGDQKRIMTLTSLARWHQ